MSRFASIFVFAFQVAHSAELPSLSEETMILHVPLAEYITDGSILHFTADLEASLDFSVFNLVSAEIVDPPSVDVTENNIDLAGIGGNYEGSLTAYEPGSVTKVGPFASCPTLPFNPGSTSMTINSDGPSIDLTIDVFPDLTCMLSGLVVGDSVSGTFECSDFNDGNWTSSLLKTIADTEILVAGISFSGDSCYFDTNFAGVRD